MHPPIRAMGLVFAIVVATPVLADEASDRRDCASTNGDAAIAACTRLLELPDLPAADIASFYRWRGEAYLDADSYDEAVADFTAAIERNPENARAYRDRGEAYIAKEEYALAEADLEASIALNPEDYWAHNRLGLALYLDDKEELAIDSYTRALELNPESANTYDLRGDANRFLERYAEAVADATAAIDLVPRVYAPLYDDRATANYRMGNNAEALHDFRIVTLADPNDDFANYMVGQLAPAREVPAGLPPLAFVAPAPGLTVTYVETVGPEQPYVDPMEAAIMALVAFFAPPEVPPPDSVTRKRYAIGITSGVTTSIMGSDVYDPQDTVALDVDYGLLQSRLTAAPPLPGIRAEYAESAAQIWHLERGQRIGGTGVMLLQCPATVNPITRLMGCLPGIEEAPIGEITWSATFDGWEYVVVPVGQILTAKISYDETAEMTILGQAQTRYNKVSWWFDPEIGWWLRRERTERQVADELGKVQVLEADAIEQP